MIQHPELDGPKRLGTGLLLAMMAGAALAGTPQHEALSGPYSVPTAWTTQTIAGVSVQVPTAWSDTHWIATPAFYAACPALTIYRETPAPLPRVWAGDNPDSPTRTIALAFPSASTAETRLLACGPIEPLP